MGKISVINDHTVLTHEGTSIPIAPELAAAILDFAREKASGKLEINFAGGGVATIFGVKQKRYK